MGFSPPTAVGGPASFYLPPPPRRRRLKFPNGLLAVQVYEGFALIGLALRLVRNHLLHVDGTMEFGMKVLCRTRLHRLLGDLLKPFDYAVVRELTVQRPLVGVPIAEEYDRRQLEHAMQLDVARVAIRIRNVAACMLHARAPSLVTRDRFHVWLHGLTPLAPGRIEVHQNLVMLLECGIKVVLVQFDDQRLLHDFPVGGDGRAFKRTESRA